LIVDEAHHFAPTHAPPAKDALPVDLSGVAAITVWPRELPRPLLERLEMVVGVGAGANEVIADFCAARGLSLPASSNREMRKGEELGSEAQQVEKEAALEPAESRKRILAAIDRRYAPPERT